MANETESNNKGDEYLPLKDLRLAIDHTEEEEAPTFSVCFWLYLSSFTTFPATLIQVHSDGRASSPFLVINEDKKMRVLLRGLYQEEGPHQCDSASLSEVSHIGMWSEFPLKKWIHIGWEVSSAFVRLHIDGEIVGEKTISSLFNKDSTSTGFPKKTLVFCGGGDSDLQGYVYSHNVLPSTSSIMDYIAKDLPVQLSIVNSSVSEIDGVSDGIWNIVGGKASCRRIFSLDVTLLDAFGNTVNKELEVIASLAYADNGAHVEKTSDGEAPLLTSHDGIEFSSCDRPSKMVEGHASFKLKTSQLSSKCENRLFRIMFQIQKWGNYPFLKAFTPPIRSISRSPNTRVSSLVLGKSPFAPPVNVNQSPCVYTKTLEREDISVHEEKPNASFKRFKVGQDGVSAAYTAFEQPDSKCNSHSRRANQAENAVAKNLMGRSDSLEEVNDSQSNLQNPEWGNSTIKSTSISRIPMSDVTIFKYCLAGLTEKSLLLKEIALSAPNEELLDFAHQVSLYSGCSHHRHQIVMAKGLVEEGTNTWKLISQNNNQVPWESTVFEIEEQFMKIACCTTRYLTQQDFKALKRIAGCQEYLAQENFEKMWCWLYPVAITLSKRRMNTMWSSTSPKWIEGFITKEEAESSLQASSSLQEAGTFVLRFPTSRSWPHPDAGSLVVTYLGRNHHVHHKLISHDTMFSSEEKNEKPLQDMLLAEPELSWLGRITRSH